ncbi:MULTISPECIES: hypothetical protein [unclassified Bradyrhizobium]|uniref:hypothetical protein n=1 Tax=unclassified Bradyrhizobium TaxID=2631580 RepID=UPI0029168E80|nr:MULTISPECIES: hypothetical protein [unclassified Bradyrhizobium]
MRKIVDTNYLKSDKLREYLSDPANIAVVPDYVMVEALASGDPESICERFKILSEYPNQVKVLKSTYAISGLRSKKRSRGLQKRLIDKDQSANFKRFHATLERARDGDEAAKQLVSQKSAAAATEIARLRQIQETYTANLAEHAKKYTDAELAILTKGKAIPPELLNKITAEIVSLADHMFAAHGYFKEQPPTTTLSNAFIFRYAIAGYVVALRCLKEGGAQGASAKNIGNQIIDAMIAAYATYFDGFMSEDKRAQQIFDTTGDLLKFYHHDIKRFEAASVAEKASAVASVSKATASAKP